MAEVLVDFDMVLRGPDGHRYSARACGRQRPDRLWEGWIEFPSLDGGETVRTARETTQPNRDDLLYWATGLTDPYLDGALTRVLGPPPIVRRRVGRPARPHFDGPAEPPLPPPPPVVVEAPIAILDPFHVYAEGDEVLRGQLLALSESQLRNIVRVHRLASIGLHELERLSKPELVAMIMRGVEERM